MDIEQQTEQQEAPEFEQQTEPSPALEETAAPVEPSDEGQAAGEPVEQQQTRAQRKSERGRIFRENEGLKAELSQLRETISRMNEGQRQQADVFNRLGKTLERAAPPELSEVDKLQAQIDDVLPLLGKVPEAYDTYKRLQSQLIKAAAREVAREEVQQFRQSMPRQPNAEQLAMAAKFPWLTEDDDAREAAERTIRLLVRKSNRNMANPEVRRATLEEACLMVARQFDLPVRGEDRPHNGAAGRFAGTSGKSGFSSGGGVALEMDDRMKAIADRLFPALRPEQRYARYRKEILEPEIRGAATART